MTKPFPAASPRRLRLRLALNRTAKTLFLLSTAFALAVLAVLIAQMAAQSRGWLDWPFLSGKLSLDPERAGILGAIVGSFGLMLVMMPVAFVLGVATAVYLEEYAREGRLKSFIQTNISNLAGVPSVIFGLLGLTVFNRLLGLGSSILAGGLTLSLLVLPIVVVSGQEAIRAVPGFLREAAYAAGATKWQTVRRVVLPAAMPGILTGFILAVSRAIGETAPLVVLGVPVFLLPVPDSLLDDFTALPVQIYYWTLDAVLVKAYANLAAAAIVVLLALLFLLNAAAIWIRAKYQRRY